jgi:hypothetical protein
MSDCPRPIKRAIPEDLILAIYKAEGWRLGDRAGFNSRSARCNQLYDITADPRHNRYVALRKTPTTEQRPEGKE